MNNLLTNFNNLLINKSTQLIKHKFLIGKNFIPAIV